MMASHQHDALWAKLHELELQLAAYKLLRAPRGDGVGADTSSAEATRRGRQYDAYMRRRDARREAASSAEQRPATKAQPQQGRGGKPMSPRVLRCTQEVKKALTVSIPSTPRRDTGAAMPRSRTVNGSAGGATGSPARSHHHQRRGSLGAPADNPITPRPFLKRDTGTGGAAGLRTPRAHDLPSVDVPTTSTPRPPQLERGRAHAPRRHVRSVSELPLDTAALARKRWGSPERPAAVFDSHRDFSKGLKKLLSFVRKGDAHTAAPGTATAGSGKPVGGKGWSGRMAACSLLDRATLDGHRLPMTRTVGISG